MIYTILIDSKHFHDWVDDNFQSFPPYPTEYPCAAMRCFDGTRETAVYLNLGDINSLKERMESDLRLINK